MVSLDNQFSLIQWNILGLESCDQQAFPFVSEQCLQWENRKKLFCSILKENQADIFCFEEVDKYDEFKDIFIQISNQFDSIYFQKQSGNPQGIAVFYNKSKFNLIKSYKLKFFDEDNGKEMSQFCLVNFFTFNNKRSICVIATHLKAKERFEKIRVIQINQVCKHLSSEEFLNNYRELNCEGLVFCGDFNAEPTYECIRNMCSYKFIDSFLSNAFEKSEITTYKIRDKEYARVIDYIFYYNLELISLNKLMQKKEIGDKGLPSLSFPSDHLFLKADFKLK